MDEIVLSVRGLQTTFHTRAGPVRAVDGISYDIGKGRTLGIVGESGCGKSVTSYSVMRLIEPPGEITGGAVLLHGEDLLSVPEERMEELRGSRVAMIFQEPMTALNPVFTVGNQISEVLATHQNISDREALERSVDLLQSVGIPSPEKRVHEYPHQLSGGMRQRVMIAMAIACRPSLVLADEPTTALDVTIQAHILELLTRIQAEMGMAMVLVTHDLGLIAERAHEVAVMYAGRIVEKADTVALFAEPLHPYTRGLMASIPRPGEGRRSRLRTIPGSVPRLSDLPQGCTFSPRCDIRIAQCEAEPDLVEVKPGHLVRCWKAT